MTTPPTSPTPTTPQPPAAPTAPATTEGGGDKGYKATLNLPKTSFPMKANLVQNEPASLKRWAAMSLYEKTRERRAGSARFVFHDGPPYANGSIHMGHLMNKCLKDFVVRAKTMAGLECPYVPGWDCHGLPIEHKVMQELVESKKIDKLRTLEEGQRRMAVRRECKGYAEKFVKLQSVQMQRLLTLADYAHPYLTMSPEYEGATLEVLAGLLEKGLVYRALKPVHWSIANQTALAEAELEYYDREDISVYVDFESLDADAVYSAFGLPESADDDEGDDAEGETANTGATDDGQPTKAPRAVPGRRPDQRPSFMIWTTTPWTLPANVGVAVNPKNRYSLVFVDGNVTVMATDLVEKVTRQAKAQDVVVLATVTGDKLVGLRYRHPFVTTPPACGLARDCDPLKLWSIVPADYVTLEDGTGLVHTAPGHGEEDFQSGLREHLPVYNPVKGDGTYDESAPDWLRGVSVWDANKKVTEWLRNSGHLFYDHVFTHSYPHDWRSKTPTIFRCTEQWFVSVDGGHGARANLRQAALDATKPVDQGGHVNFVPEWGRNRMRGMLESRPDWCISRQRSWGLPIPAFFTPEGGTLMTPASVRAVAKAFREKGSDAWFTDSPADLLKHYDPATDPDYPKLRSTQHAALSTLTKGQDILDVWFESGSSWNAVLNERSMGYPADLYLEGSDQHRGWFQLSLLPAIGVTGRAPFKTLLTHGFMVDKNGRKMSKSEGNALQVEDVLKEYGADVCRWWVASLSYENDVKVDKSFFDVAGESYRKVRNTLRFMLSNLYDFTSPPTTPQSSFLNPQSYPPISLDAWVLAEYERTAKEVVAAYHAFDFRTAHGKIYAFCNDTLSSVYLAAVKDRLYCDKPDSPRRRRTQATLWALTDGLVRLLAPVIPHSADEAYRALHKLDPTDASRSVHLETFIESFGVAADPAWTRVFEVRELALRAMERAKGELGVDNPLDAGVVLPDPDRALSRIDPVDLTDLLGVSRAAADPAATEVQIQDLRAEPRCERSWKRDATVRQRSDGGMLTDRDAAAVGVQ